MNKISKIFILTLFSILILITTSMAADSSYQIELLPNKTEVIKGEAFYITIEIDPSTVEGGIGAYTAEIKYDSNVFEITKLEGLGNWETPIINDGKIIATTNDGECVTTKQEIAKITFIAKTDIINTTSEIQVENFQASNVETIETAENKKVEIGIKQEEISPGEEQNNNTPGQSTNTNKQDSLANSNLPFAGMQNTIIPIISVIILIAITVAYRVYKKNHEK